MKKFIAILFVTISLLTLALCGCGSKTPDKLNADGEITYNTRQDYSGIQGYKNWYYLTARDSLEDTEYMIWDEEMCTWRMNDINCLIEPNIVHPGQLDQVIRAWKAPANGKVSYDSQLQRRPVNRNGIGQDGCYVYVALSDDEVLYDNVFDQLDLDMHDISGQVNVKKGEMIYFVLNCNGNYTFDQTYWDITITFKKA